MKKMISLIFILCIQKSQAQTREETGSPDVLVNSLESIAEQSGEESEDLHWNEMLDEFLRHPLNLNTADPDELKSFPFFSDAQVHALIAHRSKFGLFIALEELQVMDEFDPAFIRKLKPYVILGATAGQKALNFSTIKTGKNMFLFRVQKILEPQAGYLRNPKGETDYPGSNEKFFLKYAYDLPGRLRFGFTAEKDPGEEFFHGNQKNGFDFYSAFVVYKSKGWLRQFIIGDFAIQAGQGLACWSGLSFGKSAEAMQIKKNQAGIYPYTSVDENRFMRGTAISLAWKSFKTDLFYSSHALDANPGNEDSMTAVTSLQTAGYHRTTSELKSRHTINELTSGGMIRYEHKNLSVGGIAYWTIFSKNIEKVIQPYNEFEFRGKENINMALHYAYVFRNTNLFGEIARSKNGSYAALQGFLIQLHPRLSTSILIRKYDRAYQSIKSSAFGENSQTENEEGIYWGINLKLPRGLSVNTYLDMFHFSWLRYQVDAPSSGNEYLAQLNWVPGKKFETSIRVQVKAKQENSFSNDSDVMHQLVTVNRNNLRWNIRTELMGSLTCSARVEWTRWKKEAGPAEAGYLMYTDFQFHPMQSKFSASIRYAVFNCENYEARIYTYENDVLFSNSIPAYQGTGIRYYANMRYQMGKGIDIWFRFARTVYDQVATIGQGPDQINGNKKSDLKAQVRFLF